MDLWTSLEAARNRWNVLEHPFYQRWSDGTLSRQELATYSVQYREAVIGLAEATTAAAAAASGDDAAVLDGHAAEEQAHVAIWDEFATSMGANFQDELTEETKQCRTTWAGESRDGVLEHLVAMYAIESAQPEISKTKLTGLVERYDVTDPAALRYFALHAERDIEHAAEGKELIQRNFAGADLERLTEIAEDVYRSNWELLDGVDRVLGVNDRN